MENIRAKLNDAGKLVLFIDPKVKGELSGTGKSHVIASARWADLSDIPGCEGLSANIMIIRKLKKTGKKETKPAEDEDDSDGEHVEKRTANKGKRPKLNKDKGGKVKPIATSKRPADKLKAKRVK